MASIFFVILKNVYYFCSNTDLTTKVVFMKYMYILIWLKFCDGEILFIPQLVIQMNTKRKKVTLERSGIYSLKCQYCNAVYVGKTGRNLKIRYNEHLKGTNSKIYRHMKLNKHKVPLENLTPETPMEKTAVSQYTKTCISIRKKNMMQNHNDIRHDSGLYGHFPFLGQ